MRGYNTQDLKLQKMSSRCGVRGHLRFHFGGLLVSCASDIADQVLTCFHSQGFGEAR